MINVTPNDPNDKLIQQAMAEIGRAIQFPYDSFDACVIDQQFSKGHYYGEALEICSKIQDKVNRNKRLIMENSISGYNQVFQSIGYDLEDAKTLTNLIFQSGVNGEIFYHLRNSDFLKTVNRQAYNGY